MHPVSEAKDGFTPAQAAEMLGQYSNRTAMQAGDVSLFSFLNFGEFQRVAVIPRDGPVVALEQAPDPAIGKIRLTTEFGTLTLEEYLVTPATRAQGIVVIRGGRIVFEAYPGMRPNDYKVWMSTTKTTASLVIRLLVEQGLIDIGAPVPRYLPEFAGTEWDGVRVIDALDMATGLDAVETNATRGDPESVVMRMNLAGGGVPYKGRLETMAEVLKAAKRMRPAGEAFDYGSPITLILPMLAEAVTNRRWPDLFGDLVWSKMTVEGDMLMGMAPDGLALAHGLAVTRLRDLARYGMLYTPSWAKAARERIVSDAYIREIQTGGNPAIYDRGEMGAAMVKYFIGERPVSNHWQWDAVFADGDFYKNGLMGQGLYVSPSKDAVVVFFSTVYDARLTAYARSIVKSFPLA